MLSKKEQKAFVEFHRGLYGDTSKDTGTGELPKICIEDEDKHEKLRKQRIKKNIKINKEQKEKVFQWLRMGFGPSSVDSNKEKIGVEVRGWYDGIAYYEDEFGNRYSRNGTPIMRDEMCRYGYIYKVKEIDEYEFEILSKRKDL